MKLEKMQYKDISEVAERLSNAFSDKFTRETTLSKETAKKLMKLLWLEEYKVFGMQPYVLKDGEDVVGAFGVSTRQRYKLSVSLVAKTLAAVRVIGLQEMRLFAEEGLQTNRKPDKDELYIDFIAVKETLRNQGIGHRLMEEIERLKESRPELRKISLYVLKDNEPARHLYSKYGFKEEPKQELASYLYLVKE